MRAVGLPVLLLIVPLSGCTNDRDRRDPLADRIENAIVLPQGAFALADYERYYAVTQGVVRGVYTIHGPGYREFAAQGCRELAERPFPCPRENGELRLVEPGQRAWVDDAMELPGRSGGGCSQVDIAYRIADGAFLYVECNGDH
jgi:hypothetical protein